MEDNSSTIRHNLPKPAHYSLTVRSRVHSKSDSPDTAQDGGDFTDYFGPRWHYYLGNVIAEIPIPFRFANLEFEQGVAALFLNHYADKPHAYLDEKQARQPAAVDGELVRKFADLAFDDSTDGRRQDASPGEADNVDVGPLTAGDLQRDLLPDSNCPF